MTAYITSWEWRTETAQKLHKIHVLIREYARYGYALAAPRTESVLKPFRDVARHIWLLSKGQLEEEFGVRTSYDVAAVLMAKTYSLEMYQTQLLYFGGFRPTRRWGWNWADWPWASDPYWRAEYERVQAQRRELLERVHDEDEDDRDEDNHDGDALTVFMKRIADACAGMDIAECVEKKIALGAVDHVWLLNTLDGKRYVRIDKGIDLPLAQLCQALGGEIITKKGSYYGQCRVPLEEFIKKIELLQSSQDLA
jgi:hypothetical protein